MQNHSQLITQLWEIREYKLLYLKITLVSNFHLTTGTPEEGHYLDTQYGDKDNLPLT